MSKFKVGEKVRVIDDRENLRVKNKIGVLKADDKDYKPYQVYFEDIDDYFWFYEHQLELVDKKPTKQELLDMPVGTKIYTDAENEDYQEFVFDGDAFRNARHWLEYCEINEDLTLINEGYGTKIIKIEVPAYETVYDYSTEVQEMTVSEIEKVLGHAVKIIKEDK